MPLMKIIPIVVLVFFSSCQLKDVLNPNVTDVSFIGTTQSSQVWLNGMQRQLAQTLNQTISFTEIVSDNYYNNSSLSNKVFDIPTILYSDLDVDNMQRAIGRLSEMAEYGISQIIPADAGTTPDIKSEIYFIGGFANLLKGEINHSVVLTANGEIVPAAESFKKAINYFTIALQTQTVAAKKNFYTLALARAYYNLGDKTNAVNLATTIRSGDPLLLLNAVFDGVNGVSNTMQTYTFSSSTNTYAPLPRLDFLDPKYYHIGNAATDQKPIAILKGEEAYLILAEAAIGRNDVSGAKLIMKELISQVISKRPTAQVNGSIAQRKGNRSDYPLLATVKVKFDAASPERSGFILDRQAGNITVYRVSGTSVTATNIDAASGSDDLLYLLCQMRQEIFMSEGRRMTDLGIRFPVSQVEMQNNPNVKPEHTLALIPSYIPNQLGLDDFVYDRAAGVVTMKYDMNKVLVQNKTASGVLPMLK